MYISQCRPPLKSGEAFPKLRKKTEMAKHATIFSFFLHPDYKIVFTFGENHTDKT